jgi:L-asparaginase
MMKILKQVLSKAFNFSKLSQKIPELKQLDCEIETISFESQFLNMNPRIVQNAEIIEDNCFI